MEWQPPKAKTPFEKIDDSKERAQSDGFWGGLIVGISTGGALCVFVGILASVVHST